VLPIYLILAIAGSGFGLIFLVLDFVNRVFGSYARSFLGTVWRLGLIVLGATLLAAPPALLLAGRDSGLVRGLCVGVGVLGWLIALHFLVPYKWGVKRIPESKHQRGVRPLGGGVQLQDCHLEVADLPGDRDRLTIVALSDLHCTTHRKTQTLLGALRSLDQEDMFDFVLVLGDLGENPELLPEVMRGLAEVPSRHGVYCVRGNHDFEGARESLVRDLAAIHGVFLLPNEVHHVPGTEISLVGIELPWDRAPLPGPVEEGRFVIGLSHTPDNIRRLADLNVDLAFAGHTHGGRVKIPFLGSALVPGLLGRFMERGLFRLDGTRLYVTAGVGYFLARFGKQGEILRVVVSRREEMGSGG
jgi:hypothetical protein